jgi:hypothetical protein
MKTNAIAFTIPAVAFIVFGKLTDTEPVVGMGLGILVTAWITYYDFIHGRDRELEYDASKKI